MKGSSRVAPSEYIPEDSKTRQRSDPTDKLDLMALANVCNLHGARASA
jgi:hypothetical protein